MEENKHHLRPKPLQPEPGRRYAAGRVLPRAGGDIRRPTHRSMAAQHKVEPVTPKVHVAKHLDVIDPNTIHTPAKKLRKVSRAKPALPRTTRSYVLSRHISEGAVRQRKKARKIYWRHIVGYSLLSVILVALAVVGWSFKDLAPVHLPFMNNEPKTAAVVDPPNNQETSTLDETVIGPEDIAAHSMGDDEPKILRIPKLGVEARIRRVGVSLSGEPVAPSNIFDVGWFEASGKPGQPGAVLLNGNVVGPTRAGVFATVHELVSGDQIVLERGDGTLLTYKVTKTQEYNQLDMSAATNPIDLSKQGLNLMTTVNKYSALGAQSEKRVIVFAVQ